PVERLDSAGDEVRGKVASEVNGGIMADFKTIVPVLKVADMERAVGFYTSVLGFTVCWQAANDGGGENRMLVAVRANSSFRPARTWATSRTLPARCTST